jgi:DNA repair protein RadA/Sms
MNDPVGVRRFVCPSCAKIHFTWAARCAGCLSLKGLVAMGPEGTSSLPPQTFPASEREVVDEAEEIVRGKIELPRPRLTIARAPDPEFSDPGEESASAPVPISEITEASFVRDSTGLPPLDHVLGGGLVVASVVLLASPPGIGKTSLTLQMLVGLGHRCLYITGEETEAQVAATARRIGAVSERLYVWHERDLARIFEHARLMRVQTIAIDSIQKMLCTDVNGRAGSPLQLKECTARAVDYAKMTKTSLWLIGHVTSDGDIAGPKTIEHDVDVVLEMAQGTEFEGNERILRCPGKNRFGPTNVVGRFELTGKGFAAVDADGWNVEL